MSIASINPQPKARPFVLAPRRLAFGCGLIEPSFGTPSNQMGIQSRVTVTALLLARVAVALSGLAVRPEFLYRVPAPVTGMIAIALAVHCRS